jgi:hypothetical protein
MAAADQPSSNHAEQVVELIDRYRARWEIEIYFHVLKNGCEVETLQLGAVDWIERALALFMVVAWRITYLMRLGRTCPDLDAALFFSADEIRGTYLLTKQSKPAQPPRLNDVIRSASNSDSAILLTSYRSRSAYCWRECNCSSYCSSLRPSVSCP